MSHQIKLHYASAGHRALIHAAASGAPCDCPPGYVCIGSQSIIAHEPPLLVAVGVILVVVFAVGYFLGKRAAINRQSGR
jgi:hypothetical protein